MEGELAIERRVPLKWGRWEHRGVSKSMERTTGREGIFVRFGAGCLHGGENSRFKCELQIRKVSSSKWNWIPFTKQEFVEREYIRYMPLSVIISKGGIAAYDDGRWLPVTSDNLVESAKKAYNLWLEKILPIEATDSTVDIPFDFDYSLLPALPPEHYWHVEKDIVSIELAVSEEWSEWERLGTPEDFKFVEGRSFSVKGASNVNRYRYEVEEELRHVKYGALWENLIMRNRTREEIFMRKRPLRKILSENSYVEGFGHEEVTLPVTKDNLAEFAYYFYHGWLVKNGDPNGKHFDEYDNELPEEN